ncbi:hypothetical protein [Candidatus Absconditicoccus praedator]|uniref:hypothetical protein n=1 Tax=Candidatus Absconditicoccus praedator TaxID=2735562 RepID=UPI001E323F6F|nr:hypothetical protein [Candidatus Absconditicoccus praedator]UFX82702.1 hypothetical protein HLG78_00935 [Candidatus Absconditicoccus praedator]
MKIFVSIILAFIVGYLFGAYSSFNIMADFSAENASKAFNEAMERGYDVYTGDEINIEDVIQQQRDQIVTNFNQRIEEYTQEMKDNTTQYLKERIASIFSSDNDN